MIKLQLHENWQLCNIRQLDWIPAQIPGDIYAALLKTGKMPDPFFGDNEYQAKALMEEDYEYRTVFNYEEAQFKDCQEVILRFDGIDTIADIYLNGCCLGKVDNMHRIWEFPVGELLENGKNTLRVIIRSPLKFMAEAFKKYKNSVKKINKQSGEKTCPKTNFTTAHQSHRNTKDQWQVRCNRTYGNVIYYCTLK